MPACQVTLTCIAVRKVAFALSVIYTGILSVVRIVRILLDLLLTCLFASPYSHLPDTQVVGHPTAIRRADVTQSRSEQIRKMK